MHNIEIVIGLSYGDEGKGITTDYLARRSLSNHCAVVRFNGGAQAGHTVVTPEGVRHVFQHFGSGTLAGKPTILSKYFMVNPTMFFVEANALADKKVNIPQVYVDPNAMITTPVDIIINRYLEHSREEREEGKHGSCGMGINETQVRNDAGYTLCVKDITGVDFVKRVSNIVNQYMPARMYELGITLSKEVISELDKMMMAFKRDCADFVRYCKVYPDCESFELFDHLIFEGAQGLRLSQDSRDFPHVTRSYTGLRNVLELTKGLACTMSAYYVTRTYLTRHGAGPLENEYEEPIHVYDPTNDPNLYQGIMRYAPLNVERIREEVEKDIGDNKHIKKVAVVTHCDIRNNNELINKIVEAVGTDKYLCANGPTHQHMVMHNR